MADQTFDEDLDDDTPKPKNRLRDQLEETLAKNKTLTDELAALKQQVRGSLVQQALAAKGVNPKIAKFIPADVEGDEAIGKWLDENAELFGGIPQSQGDDSATDQARVLDPSQAAEARRLQALGQSAVTPDQFQNLTARLDGAKTPEEVDQIWASEVKKYFL